jgi:hypothetical protein
MPDLRTLCDCCLTGGVPRRSLIAALVVGTVLNLINQGDALFGGKSIDWVKLLLTLPRTLLRHHLRRCLVPDCRGAWEPGRPGARRE